MLFLVMQKQNRCFFKHTSHCPHILRHQPADHQIMLVKILGMFHSVILADHTPLQIHSDGNCLYRAIPRGMFGYEEEHELIRLLATLEIAEHREFYDYAAANFIDLVKDNQIVSTPYTTLLKEAATLTQYSEMLHIYAMSAATGLALRSYCPPTINAEYLSAHLTRKIWTSKHPSFNCYMLTGFSAGNSFLFQTESLCPARRARASSDQRGFNLFSTENL